MERGPAANLRALNRQPCVILNGQPSPKKENAFTRTLGQPATGIADLIKAVSAFASGTESKLRKQCSLRSQLPMFIHIFVNLCLIGGLANIQFLGASLNPARFTIGKPPD